MILTPILTEKSLKDAKTGFYTFWVDKMLTKFQIKGLISQVYDVHVVTVKTMNYKGGTKKNFRGKTQVIKARKKALVTLAEKEKIDLFESKK